MVGTFTFVFTGLVYFLITYFRLPPPRKSSHFFGPLSFMKKGKGEENDKKKSVSEKQSIDVSARVPPWHSQPVFCLAGPA